MIVILCGSAKNQRPFKDKEPRRSLESLRGLKSTGISRLHFIYLLISAVLYVLTSLTFLISGLHSPHFWSWKLFIPVLLLTSLIGLVNHYKFDMNIGLRTAKAMKRVSIFHFVLLVLAIFLSGNLFVTKGIAFERKTDCWPEEERIEKLETLRPPLYGAIFIGEKGTAHVFLNYMGIVVSSTGKQLEFEFEKNARQYISELGGASFLITPRFLEEYSSSNLQVLETINLLETKVFWSYQNCLMVEPRGEKTKQYAQEHNIQVWAVPSIISDFLLVEPTFQPLVGISQVNLPDIWPDSGNLNMKILELQEQVKKRTPWQPGDPIKVPWHPPQIFIEDIEKVEKFSGLVERKDKSVFYIFLGKIKPDGSLSRQCVGVVTREPGGNVTKQWLSSLQLEQLS